MLVNIIIGVLVIGLTILIHGYGTIYWIKFIRKKYKKKTTKSLSKRIVWILIYSAIFLLSLNFIEAIIWGFTYYLLPGITEFESIEKAIYFSLVTFTTLGYGDITINSANRMLAGFEAMNGALLLGWTTAMMFSLLQLIVKDLLKKVKTNETNNLLE
jgi:voltage-gated potassium channel Kch